MVSRGYFGFSSGSFCGPWCLFLEFLSGISVRVLRYRPVSAVGPASFRYTCVSGPTY